MSDAQGKPAATRGLAAWVVLVSGMALVVIIGVATVLGTSDSLPADILLSLKSAAAPTETHWQTIVDGPPTGVARGIQLGLLSLLLGSVPVAILGWALAARESNPNKPWSGAWGSVFLAGFVFQLTSLVFTAFIFVLLLWVAYESDARAQEIIAFAIALLVGVICGAWGVRSWRVLQLQVQDLPATIARHDAAG